MNLSAQEECPVQLPPGVNPPETLVEGDFCFDISYVMENCIPFYLNVNVHFFLDDNCEGYLAGNHSEMGQVSAFDAFHEAELLIDSANAYYEVMSQNPLGLNYQWNAAAHGATVTGPNCVPIRYVLDDVFIHCDTDAQDVNVSFQELNQYLVNANNTINVFVSNVIGGTSGYASFSTTNNNFVVEQFGDGLFNHEAGHVFHLRHTHTTGGDKCSDTWYYEYNWDADCDGEDEYMYYV